MNAGRVTSASPSNEVVDIGKLSGSAEKREPAGDDRERGL